MATLISAEIGQFLFALWWETVNLEVDGPAHQLLVSWNLTAGQLASSLAGTPDLCWLQSEFISGDTHQGPRITFSSDAGLKEWFTQLEQRAR